MRCLHDVYNEKGSFWGYLLTIQNACPTVKAFHRMNLNWENCEKPIKMAANRVGCV